MRKILSLIFSIVLLSLTSCSSKNIADDTTKVNNKDSLLIPVLLSQTDFNADWKLNFGEVSQHRGGTENVAAEEYASYYLSTKYLPLQVYYTFIHSIYHIKQMPKIDTNEFISFDQPNIHITPSEPLTYFPRQKSQCFKYQEINGWTCVFIESSDPLVSKLSVTTPSNISIEEILTTITPIIDIIQNKIDNYNNLSNMP